MGDHDDFRRRWERFVRRWGTTEPEHRDRLVRAALSDGLPEVEGRSPAPGTALEVRCAKAVLRASGAFDEEGYAAARANRVVLRGTDPLTQFVTQGWRELRAPSLVFDLWWYWCEYLDPTREDVNPLLHYVLAGRQVGHLPVPPPAPSREHPRLTDPSPRRICLFAAYDRDGLVDEHVLAYLRELGRHADVYYLADGVLEPGELDKLDGIVRGAWSIPHAAATTSARTHCWPGTWSGGTPWRRTTSCSSSTTAASCCALSTRPSPSWTLARATGGACRRRPWSSTRTTSTTPKPGCRWPRRRRPWWVRAAGPTCPTCT